MELIFVALFALVAWAAVSMIAGPPLERYLRKRNPGISFERIQGARDLLLFFWALIVLATLVLVLRERFFKSSAGLF